MSEVENFSVQFVASNQASTPASLQLQKLSLKHRIVKVNFVLFICCVFTLMMLAIPVLHFFLVPISLLLSLVLITRSFNASQVILSGIGPCPSCGEQVQIMKRSFKLPFQESCEHCRREMSVVGLSN